jgi:hypothetical protein
MRLYQATSATAILVSDLAWKNLLILPGQTLLESGSFQFPPVNAQTRFLLQWLDGSNLVLGITDVWVYPEDLLKELKTVAEAEPLGVFDPQNEVKPLLKAVSVDTADLQEIGLDHFQGKLAILGPFNSKAQMRDGFTRNVKALAQKGAAIVWIQPPADSPVPLYSLKPSFYIALEAKGAIVIAQPSLVVNLSKEPRAQLNLIQLARLAARPKHPHYVSAISDE